MKLIALLFLIALLCACAADRYDHYNRRDLYNPVDGWPGEIQPVRSNPPPTPEVKPQVRG